MSKNSEFSSSYGHYVEKQWLGEEAKCLYLKVIDSEIHDRNHHCMWVVNRPQVEPYDPVY